MRATVEGAPQNELRARWIVWKPGPSAGSLTAPAMHPAAWLPMTCKGPGAGVSGEPAITSSAGSTVAMHLEKCDAITAPERADDSNIALDGATREAAPGRRLATY